jgi:hypothetical protein
MRIRFRIVMYLWVCCIDYSKTEVPFLPYDSHLVGDAIKMLDATQ